MLIFNPLRQLCFPKNLSRSGQVLAAVEVFLLIEFGIIFLEKKYITLSDDRHYV